VAAQLTVGFKSFPDLHSATTQEPKLQTVPWNIHSLEEELMTDDAPVIVT
jgi:hypothetical protein